MRFADEEQYYEATVPGSVYQDLLDQGRMEDPYYRDNENCALELMRNNFIYRTSFDVEQDLLTDVDEVLLRFHGLDTIADITLNGTLVGHAENMHRTWDYSVTKLLKDKDNELTVYFHSPVQYIEEQYEKDPAILGSEDAMRGFPKIRKGHYMFGWDWGPRLPDVGIWKPVELLFVQKARLTKTLIRQQWDDALTQVELSVEAKLVLAQKADNTGKRSKAQVAWEAKEADWRLYEEEKGLKVCISILDPDGNTLVSRLDATESVRIDNPRLWWPNGFGEQPLYTVVVELLSTDDGRVLDRVDKRIGLRTMTMSTAKDTYGSEFAHVVNGVKIFAMGADYIPEDNILPRTSPERTRQLLEQCCAANFNCIRVWGGGLYPDDAFFDACDELGLIVWQDFMFACANYRLTKEFEENILAELKDQVRRLAHHACLGLWCGNNEMEMFADRGTWGAVNGIKNDYVKMYEYLFPKLLEEEDPDRFYWPASPSTGGGFDEPNDPNRGDVHYWDVWHGNKPFTEYRKFYFRYLSEFGFQSFPSIRTIETFTLPKDRNIFSYVMEKHQRNVDANGKIMNYMEQTFLYPSSLDTLVYASQLLQAEAIRYGVEHFRRNRGRCMGTIYWQLNDCWPVASWSSIDYYGRWKALHYYAKRFFAPVLLSCEEEGMQSQTQNVNAEPFPVRKSIRLNVTNETMQDQNVTVSWQLREADGTILRGEECELCVDSLSAVWCDKVELPEAKLYDNYVSYSLTQEGQVVSEGTVLFCAPKHFNFVDPDLRVRVEGDELVVSAKHFAKSVQIVNAMDDLIVSDNYFDLNGAEKRVRILKGEPVGLSVRSVYDIR